MLAGRSSIFKCFSSSLRWQIQAFHCASGAVTLGSIGMGSSTNVSKSMALLILMAAF
jgi:hypothetical protein